MSLTRQHTILRTAVAVAAALALSYLIWRPAADPFTPSAIAQEGRGVKAPELDGGVAWLNTAGPLKLADLKGKVVLLDFWTYCCINCIHTLPDLAKLEKKYEKELVVIGVHSAKFENEKKTEAIRKAMLRYQITHPVVNDAHMTIWQNYQVDSWPTLALIDPEGNYIGRASGEGNFDRLDQAIAQTIKLHEKKGTLDRKPMRFDLAKFRDRDDTPLFFPGKLHADADSKRLFIADSTHHRIVITDLNGNKIAVAGTGEPGLKNGSFAEAQFDDPQGLILDGDTLYVADRKNHVIRALDLKAGTVKTVAGTGEQDRGGRHSGGPAATTGLNSPWDLLLIGRVMYIAMAGHHQIWTLNLDTMKVEPFAGSGIEDINDGPRSRADLAQPSGLATDGRVLFVADSEASAVRTVGLGGIDAVTTLVGMSGRRLFNFGDVDGIGDKVRLQHALAVAYHDGKVYVADTYNSKLKVINPANRECVAYLGGNDDTFNEPAGLSVAGDQLFVADTNAHRVRVVNLKDATVRTLELKGVEPPASRAASNQP